MVPEARSRFARSLAWAVALAVTLWWLAGHAAAAAELDGELGHWLDDSVAPQLGNTLSRHPRFAGQTLRLATVTPDAAGGNGLADAIERRLRQSLLEVEGLRLALPESDRGCGIPQAVDYLIRIEVETQGRRSARVDVAVVDVAESVWVSGISHQWQGRLSSAERATLDRPADRGLPGSATRPVAISRPREVADRLESDIECQLPPQFAGTVYLEAPADQTLTPIAAALRAALGVEPYLLLTPDRRQARWRLSLRSSQPAGGLRQVSAVLSDAGPAGGGTAADAATGEGVQTLGTVWVTGAAPATAIAGVAVEPADDPAQEPAEEPAEEPRVAAAPATGSLLSALVMSEAPADGICDIRQARTRGCVDVRFELREPAYLFLLATRAHDLVDAPCAASLRRAATGSHRYRLRVPLSGSAPDPARRSPDAGLYVLAVRERRSAERLHEVLNRAPALCAAPAANATHWLDDLAKVLADDGEVQWRVLHVAHDRDGIIAL